jgi:membrane associated rhomboid family serine protease
MFIPFGDEPNDPKRVPWLNYALIAANVVVFVVVVLPTRGAPDRYAAAIEAWGYTPAEPTAIALLSCMFVHATWWHLIANMLFLWIFGDNIEARLGPLGYLLAYLGAGAAGTLIFAAFDGDSQMALVGASGAVSGVLGMYLVACPRHRVKVFVWLLFLITVLRLPAFAIILFWFLVGDVVPVLTKASSQVAHAAHLGGFAAGLVLMVLLRPLVRRAERIEAGELRRTDRYRSRRSQRYRPRPPRA